MRPVIALLLIGGLMIGGCDRQSDAPEQANQSVVAPKGDGAIGTIDRSHKGEAAPTAAFQAPDGKPVTLASFAGKPLLLNLWATWCVPCVKEMPTLDALSGELGDRVQVLVVSQDLKGAEKVTPFFAEKGFKHLQPYLDTDAMLGSAFEANLPTTILYDRTGHEVWRMLGDTDWTSDAAKKLVAEAG